MSRATENFTGDARRALLDDDARAVLHAIVETFRKQMMPNMDPIRFRMATFELIDAGLARIEVSGPEGGETFRLALTGEGRAVFGEKVN